MPSRHAGIHLAITPSFMLVLTTEVLMGKWSQVTVDTFCTNRYLWYHFIWCNTSLVVYPSFTRHFGYTGILPSKLSIVRTDIARYTGFAGIYRYFACFTKVYHALCYYSVLATIVEQRLCYNIDYGTIAPTHTYGFIIVHGSHCHIMHAGMTTITSWTVMFANMGYTLLLYSFSHM